VSLRHASRRVNDAARWCPARWKRIGMYGREMVSIPSMKAGFIPVACFWREALHQRLRLGLQLLLAAAGMCAAAGPARTARRT